jgi:hypothetical protein
LAGDDRRTTAVAVLEDFQQIVTGLLVEWLEAPVVQYQELDMTQGALQTSVSAVAAGERELGKESWDPLIENGTIVTASLVTERASQPALSDARGSAYGQIVVSTDPVAPEQLHEERTVEAAVGAIIDIFRGRLMTKLGEPETRRKLWS